MQSSFIVSRRRLTRARYQRRRETPLSVRPRAKGPDYSLYIEEAVTRRLVEDMIEEVRDLRDRMMSFLLLIAGSVVVDVLMRLRGR